MNLSSLTLPWCVKFRGAPQKIANKIHDSTNIEYEFTCAKDSVGVVEGYISDIIVNPSKKPTTPICPHCKCCISMDTMGIIGKSNQYTCSQCFLGFEKPEYELLFDVRIGPSVVLTLNTKAIQQMFHYKKAIKNSKLPVTGNETYEKARNLVMNHHVKFLCHCNCMKTIDNTPCYFFNIIDYVK